MSISERLDSISRGVLIMLAGLLPFFFVPVAWVTTSQAKIGLAALVLFVVAIFWILARFLERDMRIPQNIVIGATSLLPLAYAVSAGISGAMSVSLVGSGLEADTVAFIATGFGALVLAASLFSTRPAAIRTVVHAFVFGLLALGLIQVFHIIFPSITLGGALVGQTGNAFGSWHSFAFLMGLLLFISVSFAAVPSASGRPPYASYAAVAVALFALVVANYFDVWLMVFVSMAVLVLAEGYRANLLRTASYWRSAWFSVLVMAIALFFMLFGSFVANVLPERIRFSQMEVRPSWQGTLAIGEQTLSNPLALLFGSGPNTFTRQWGLYRPLDVNQTPFWNADFSTGVAPVPTSLVTVGLFGVLAWLLSICALVFVIIRSWMRTDAVLSRTTMALSVACLALVSFHIYSIPDTAITLLMFFLVGILLAEYASSAVSRNVQFIRGGWRGWGALAGVVVFACAVPVAAGAIARVTVSEMFVNKGIVSYNAEANIQKSSTYVRNAISVYPSDRSHRAAVQLGLLELQQMIANADPQEEGARTALQATLERTIQHGLDAVSINSRDYQNWLEIASVYSQLAGANVEGAYENARAAYEQALQNNPISPLPLLNLAQLELLRGEGDLALQYLAAALERKPNLAVGYYLASQIYAGQENFEEALATAVRAVELAPNDSQAWYNAGVIAYAAGDYANAAVGLEQTLALEPQFANALYILGLSYAELGRVDEAIGAFTALDSLDPGHEEVQNILQQLRAQGAPSEE